MIWLAEVIVVTSGKGGTGKTTVSLLLAKELCRHGKNVMLLELDSGLRGLDLLLKVSDRVVFDLSDVLTGGCKPVRAITVCDVPKGNLHFIAAPQKKNTKVLFYSFYAKKPLKYYFTITLKCQVNSYSFIIFKYSSYVFLLSWTSLARSFPK